MRLLRDIGFLFAALALLAAAGMAYRADRLGRDSLEAFIASYELELRRPADVATLRLQPQADLASVTTASMTLEDVHGSVRLRDLDARTRTAWVRVVSLTDAQIAEAIALSLRAVETRPGGAFHHSMLAQLAYTKLRRESADAIARGIDEWELPALLGISLAPGNDSLRAFLGGAYLDVWDRVPTRMAPLDALRGAMRNGRFVERSYRTVAALTGEETAIGLLPDEPGVLRIALSRELRERNVERAAAVRRRLDGAIVQARARDLARIETLARRGDEYGLQSAVPAWAGAYRLEELDGAGARRQVGRIAELWPAMRRGSWASDPRGRLLRYLLDGREASVNGRALARLAEGLTNVPEPVAARALALGGEASAAEELLFSSQTRGAFEWTPAIVDIARAWLARGDAERARRVLEDLAPTARDECEVLLVMRDAAESDQARDALSRRIAALTPPRIPAASWSRTGSLSLCLDARSRPNRMLHIALDAKQPALASWGWDGGRVASVVVSGPTSLEVPLDGLSGRRALSVKSEGGGAVTFGETTIR
ncbi:MAG: hypothetical protein ACSLFQ_07780 [Thermoanaerobaculia bacterium]